MTRFKWKSSILEEEKRGIQLKCILSCLYWSLQVLQREEEKEERDAYVQRDERERGALQRGYE